jgi:hypothetical protein
MTPELQRIKIAEACGWTDFSRAKHEGAIQYGRKPLSCYDSWEVPDYLNDLNAMHEAEKTLDDDLDLDYSENLEIVTGGDMSKYRSATAAQRAEAFLRTIGKWEEEL